MDLIWLNSCLELKINNEIAQKWFHKIENKLKTESHRFFHTWNELIIKKEDNLKNVRRPIIVLAIFFQYYEFNVQHNCIEENCSAFLQFCNDANFMDETSINHVRKLLGDDSVEEYIEYREDISLIQDINLLMLSYSSEEYKIYCDLLRKEYGYLSDSSYNTMRLKILETFLTIPAIYQTPEYFAKFENKTSNSFTADTPQPSTSKQGSINLTLRTSAKKNEKKKLSRLRNNINTNNLSGRQLKELLRKSIMKKLPVKNEPSAIDDCILIEIPPEIIVIDDDSKSIVSTTTIMKNSSPIKQNQEEDSDERKSKNPLRNLNNHGIKDNNEHNTYTIVDEVNCTDPTTFSEISPKENTSNQNFNTIDSYITIDKESFEETGTSKLVNENSILGKSDASSVLTILDGTTVADTMCSIDTVTSPLYETLKINSIILGRKPNNSNRRSFPKKMSFKKNSRPTPIINLDATNSSVESVITKAVSSSASENISKENIKIVAAKTIFSTEYNENISTNASTKENQNEIIDCNIKNYDSPLNNSSASHISSCVRNESAANKNDIVEIYDDDDDDDDDNNDDSCIFVGETAFSNLDYIPLTWGNNKNNNKRKIKQPSKNMSPKFILNPFKKFKINLENGNKNMSTPKSNKRTGEIEFTNSEKKKNEVYNSNTYNPNKNETIKNSVKRMIIIDGSNVAFGHGNSNYFSSQGLEIVIDHFIKQGHQVKAVVPQFRVNHNRSSDGEKLKELHRAGKIVFTPGKNLPDLKATSYDDRFILQLALEFDAVIVSNDNYRDLINENPGFKKIIENRVITYTWCNDTFIIAKDPYGKRGPSLDSILNRNIKE